MCGIAGIFAYHDSAPAIDHLELLRIRDAMLARGPDGAGLWISADQRIGLAHRRLAIIDLTEAGVQPMSTADGRLHITFNGEIYNYRELRKDLEARGCRFRSNSDTEVLLHLYAERGTEMVHALRGMFAFAIFDQHNQNLFLARDPFGIKPLYFADNGKTIHFASQVKALLKSGKIDTTPAPAGHVGFYLWGHVPDPHTLFKGIKALSAGTSMLIDRNGCRTPKKFFDISAEFAKADELRLSLAPQEATDRLHAALRDSVQHHLIADVPVGVFLSSGLDSTMLTALAAEMGAGDLHTITLGFDEYRGTQNDETPLAELVAQCYGTTHQTKWISRADFENEREHLLEAMDQPSVDGVNTYFVSRAAAASGLKVALSGVGGDELFGGYSSFRDLPRIVGAMGIGRSLPSFGKTFRWMSAPLLKRFTSPKFAGLLEYGGSIGGAYLLRRGLYMPWELPEILDGELVREGWNELQTLLRLEETVKGCSSSFQKVSALELSWYMRNQLLRDADWAGMAHSLEIRVPLVDVELLRSVAPYMAKAPVTKVCMARAPARSLPSQVLDRKKTGFSIPVQDWLQQLDSSHPDFSGIRSWAIKINPPPKRKGRVLVLVTDAFGSYGGIAKFNRDLLGSLCSYSQCKEVVAIPRLMPSRPGLLPDKLSYFTNAINSKSKYLSKILHVVIGKGSFDFVICGHINLLPVAWLASVLTRAPLLLVIHGVDAWQPTRGLITNFLVKRIDAFISVSAVTKERFLAWTRLSPGKGFILPNSIDLEYFKPCSKNSDLLERYQLHGKTVIMTMGRLESKERYKGFDEVLDLLPEMIKDVPNLAYLIVGDGNDRRRLEMKASALGVRERVIFAGFIHEHEKCDHYNLADVFAMPSRGEGFGIVFLEAMACGVPVVGSTADGSVDALRGGALGILVNPDDHNDIKRGILEALHRPKHIPDGLEYFSYANFELQLHGMMNEWLTKSNEERN